MNVKKYEKARKSLARKLEEGRGRGRGTNYVPLYKANEAKSIGTASMIPDSQVGRTVHTLSTAETDFYYLLRWNPNVKEIREQIPLNMELVNIIRKRLGLPRVARDTIYTSDFLVTYKDGRPPCAFSVKYSDRQFDPHDISYWGKEKSYRKLMNRQCVEQVYWEWHGCEFKIVTKEDINHLLVSNIRLVLGFSKREKVVNREQKLMYLIAHRYVETPMDQKPIKPKELVEKADFDIDQLYMDITGSLIYINEYRR